MLRIALDISQDEEDKRRISQDSNAGSKVVEVLNPLVVALEEQEEEESQPSPEANHGVPALAHPSPEATPGVPPPLVPANNEVGQRIQGAPTRRHILRQNSAHWSSPVSSEPSSSAEDRQRLVTNLKLYSLIEKEVKGDGNCQFRALSDQLYHSSSHHGELRQQVVKQLRSTPEVYKGFVDDDFGSYCHQMGKNGTWGDHITLQAAADAYASRILIVSSFQEECIIEILPTKQAKLPKQPGSRTLFLSFWHEVHYGSVYPQGSTPPPDAPHRTMGSKRLHRLIHS